MKKYNIGLFIDTFYPMIDGVVMVVDNYAKRLSEYANVYVFAPSSSKETYDDSKFNYRVIRCKSVPLSFIDYSLPLPRLDSEFKKELDKCKLDLVHIHSPATIGRMGIKYAKKNNIPLVATFHSQYKKDFLRVTKSKIISEKLTKQMIKMFNKCDECWTMNNEIARIFHEEYGYKTMPKIINNATDMEHIGDIEKAKKHINKLHDLNGYKVLLFVGRINKLKNIDLIISSLKHIKNTKYKMIFIGSGQDEKYLKSIIRKNNLEKNTILLGRIIDRELLAEYYARADLFLFPSLYDSNSLVQLEAASQKTPTLFVEGSATSSRITNNKNGFIVPNNAQEYAKRIEEILKDQDILRKVSENAYKDLYISWDDEVKRIYKKYKRLIESRRL